MAAEPLRTAILLATYTGIRLRSERLTLRWRNIDLGRRELTVESGYAENGESRVIPMNSAVVEALTRLKGDPARDDVAFMSTRGERRPARSFDSQFVRAVKRAELDGEGVSIHTLRHTFASRIAMNGASSPELMDLCGWSDPIRISPTGSGRKKGSFTTPFTMFSRGFPIERFFWIAWGTPWGAPDGARDTFLPSFAWISIVLN